MSEYFRVLKRLERDEPQGVRRTQRPTAATGTEHEPQPASSAPLPNGRLVNVRPAAPVSAQAAARFATLFDNLRARANGKQLRSLVFAGVSGAEPIRAVTTGLACHAENLGLSVYLAELTEETGRALLKRHAEELEEGGTPLPLDLRGRTWSSEFQNWLAGTATAPDLVIIEGRPVAQSIDAALLARACDGLVLVAQTEVTHRDALQATAERVRVVGCRTLGLVMYGTKDRTPRWLRRLIGGSYQLQERVED